MSGPRIGSLFSGYGGLELGIQAALGGTTAWVSDIDKGACKILAHRYPGVPNLGDMTTVDWSAVEPVDVLCGGTPCQDLSHAGHRAGMTEGTRSNLWVAMREAIAQLRPGLVIWENVRGAYSASADSAVEPCPGCVGDGSGVHLRALGRVLGDLSDLGYVGGWHGLRAADIGAPHGRFRVFVVAQDAQRPRRGAAWHPASGEALGGRAPAIASGSSRVGTLLPTPRATDGTKGGPNQRGSSGDLMLPSAVALLPTPTTQDGSNNGGASQFDRNSLPLNAAVALLPTPAVNDMGASYTPEEWDAWCAKEKAKGRNGNGHGASLAIEAQRLLPTPMVGSDSPAAHGQISGQYRDAMTVALRRWGQYAEAIARWEHLTRPAPAPTMTSTKGNPQLAPAFVEWLMGLPAGWVTDVPGITRNEALRALGNGVVPQQAEAAVRFLAHLQERAA